VGAKADRKRYAALLGDDATVALTGDTRAEQVLRRFEAAADGEVAAVLSRWGEQRLILGSTWPPDEDVWIPAVETLLTHHPGLRVVLVPHEPSAERLAALEVRLDHRGIAHRRWSAFAAQADEACRCVLVDRVGILAEIYRSGTVAHVGGGYTTGVHSTLEPAAASLPVCFGPRIDNAEEALLMVRQEAGWVLYEAADAMMITDRLLNDELARTRAGERARGVVIAQMGATDRSVAMILRACGVDSSA
jgi:3-deoxy-D-manno-octulosonic-acid transferase